MHRTTGNICDHIIKKLAILNLLKSQEVKDAQGLMMNFGDAQAETQLKRKLRHLRAEHDLVKGERDHFKRLCQNLGR